MNIRNFLEKTKKKFENKNIDSALLEAEILLSFVLKKERYFIFSHPEYKLNFWQKIKISLLINQRLSGTPLAYLIGQKEFYNSNFKVNKNVLIPRPETEIMIDETLEIIKKWQKTNLNILDIGTGSGCIIISLAKKLKDEYPNIKFYGLDISKKALKIAKINAKINKINGCINFLYSNLLNNLSDKILFNPTIITANLPYLNNEQIKNSKTIQKEPRLALYGGKNGLKYYEKLFKKISHLSHIYLLCEISFNQGEDMKELIVKELPRAIFEIKKDLSGLDRLVVIKTK